MNKSQYVIHPNNHTGGGRRSRAALRNSLFLFFYVVITCTSCDKGQTNNARPTEGNNTFGPILLVGVDGVEWEVLLPLLAEQRLPTLAGLMQNGVYGRLESFIPTESPVIWTSVATGKESSKHGILHFVHNDPAGQPILYNNGDRRTKAIWNILSDYDKRVCTVGWWMTYPVEPINGVMVAQTNTAAQLDTRGGREIWKGTLLRGVPGQVYPPARQNEMVAVLADVEKSLPELSPKIFGDFQYPFSELGKRLWDNCRWAFRADATYYRITSNLLREKPPYDLTLVYFGGPDVVGHRFWRYAYPEAFEHKPAAEQIENFGAVIDNYYAYIDAKIGELIAACPENVTVMVISDHGMKTYNRRRRFNPDNPPADVNSAHHKQAPAGIFFAAGPYIRKASSSKSPRELQIDDLSVVGGVYDITPTLLAMLKIPVGLDMDGRVLTDVISERVGLSDPPETVVTHETPDFFAHRPTMPKVEEHEDERLQQLRSLGYIGGDDEEEDD